MNDQSQLPEITPAELADWLQSGEPVLVLDVREPHERSLAVLPYPEVQAVSLSSLKSRGLKALPTKALVPSQKLVIMCHMGDRSAIVTAWLRGKGWQNVYNLAGGIDAYARQVDPSIGLY